MSPDDAVRSVLEPGERVLWSGRPGFRCQKLEAVADALAALFGVPLALTVRHDGPLALLAAGLMAAALWSRIASDV